MFTQRCHSLLCNGAGLSFSPLCVGVDHTEVDAIEATEVTAGVYYGEMCRAVSSSVAVCFDLGQTFSLLIQHLVVAILVVCASVRLARLE